jgi:hypothetical protein
MGTWHHDVDQAELLKHHKHVRIKVRGTEKDGENTDTSRSVICGTRRRSGTVVLLFAREAIENGPSIPFKPSTTTGTENPERQGSRGNPGWKLLL